MKKRILILCLTLGCIACTNADRNLDNIKAQQFTRQTAASQKGVSITGETSESFIKLTTNNSSNKVAFLELGSAQITRDNTTLNGLYNLSDINNNYYKDQTLIVKPKETKTVKLAVKKDLQFRENTSTEELLSPKPWGIDNKINNNQISSIVIPVSIGKFDENITNFNLNFKK